MSNLCNASACAKLALNKVVCDTVASAALDYYAQIVDFLRNTLCIDINKFFQVIAFLTIICWIQNWLLEIVKFICKIPKVLKNIFCGKFNLCLFNCESNSSSSSSSNKSSKSKSDSTDDY